MKLLIITRPEAVEGETAICNKLFADGLERLHLRKPSWTKQQHIDWIESILPEFRHFIVLHDHHELALHYSLGGIHLNSRNPGMPSHSIPRTLSLSRSCHSIAEVEACQDDFDYVLLSPIFDSISKQGYRSAFRRDELLAARHLLERNVYALGGVTFERLRQVEELGFAGAAMLGAFWNRVAPQKDSPLEDEEAAAETS